MSSGRYFLLLLLLKTPTMESESKQAQDLTKLSKGDSCKRRFLLQCNQQYRPHLMTDNLQFVIRWCVGPWVLPHVSIDY